MRQKYIFLTGFMAAGKSTVGRILAQMLEARFLDTDAMVEQRLGMSVKEIFAHYGEESFRSCETAVLCDLCCADTVPTLSEGSHPKLSPNPACRVIATGGGMVERVRNREMMHRYGTVVYLHVPWAEINRRLQKVSNRPLADNVESDRLQLLLQERLPLYENADIIINTAGLTPDVIAQNIVSRIAS
ncbi:MAG: shikimate kinase [Desulfuromonadaceae bacterium]|nr:shikimate kinase [Desulfuromonadaceae bacterium]